MVYTNLTDLIGHTPLLKLHAVEGQKADILVKLESFNPGGSVKDRVALSMIADAEEKGLLAPGATLIEPTSGNTGVGLAWVGIAKRRRHERRHGEGAGPAGQHPRLPYPGPV